MLAASATTGGPRRGRAPRALLVLSGCGAAGEANPEKIGPRGVDELVIPTPSPDPDDFVAEVDNPWFPLAPGTVWTYDVSGSAVQRLEVASRTAARPWPGRCVVVRRTGTDRDGRVVSEGVTLLRPGPRGNVWLFGEEATAAPAAAWRRARRRRGRPGDARRSPGWATATSQERAPGVAEDRSTVLSARRGAHRAGRHVRAACCWSRTPRRWRPDELVVRRAYAEGTGLVEETTTVGGTERASCLGRGLRPLRRSHPTELAQVGGRTWVWPSLAVATRPRLLRRRGLRRLTGLPRLRLRLLGGGCCGGCGCCGGWPVGYCGCCHWCGGCGGHCWAARLAGLRRRRTAGSTAAGRRRARRSRAPRRAAYGARTGGPSRRPARCGGRTAAG